MVHLFNGFQEGYNYTAAMIFGEYFPNPALKNAVEVNMLQATFAEALGTGFLLWVIFDLWRRKNVHHTLKPLLIGLTVRLIIMVVADYTQAGLNPARDLAPRVFSYFAGWEAFAFSQGFRTIIVYVLVPIRGAVSAARIHAAIWKHTT